MSLKRTSRLARGSSRLSSGSMLEGRSTLQRGSGKLTSHPKSAGLLFEEEVANLYERITGRKAYRQAGSGSVWFRPGDVLAPEFLIECKEYASPSLEREWLEGVDQQSAAYGRTPLLAFRDKSLWRTWGILSTRDLPESFSRPEVLIRGGEKHLTVPDDVPHRFYLGFKQRKGPKMLLYAAYPLEEIFENARLWSALPPAEEL